MPNRDFLLLMPRLSFSEKKNEPEPSRDSNKTSPSRDETLGD